MSRSLLFLCVVLALSGCSYSIQGDAVPGAAPTTSSDPNAPKIPATRNIANADPCTFLTKDDLKSLGTLKAEPRRLDQPIPQSCQYIVEGGATVVTAVYQPYQDVRTRQTSGREVFIEKHSTWLTCTAQGVCTAVVAVHSERSLLVALALQGAAEDKIVGSLEPLTKAALARLPA